MSLELGMGLGHRAPVQQESKQVTEYLFVDGNCLRMHMRNFSQRYADGAELSVNWNQLKLGYEKVFYYDAIPVKERGEKTDEYQKRIQAISDLHAELSEINGYRVYEGDARKRTGRGLEQKKVDVMIAVDMLTHTIRRNMSGTGLLAGDLDFKPLLDALVNEGMFVKLLYPPKFTSQELRASADARLPMTVRTTFDWLDKDSRLLVGPIPTSSIGGPNVQNCVQIMTVDDGPPHLAVWHEQVTNTITVTWLHEQPKRYFHLTRASWSNTRKFAKDDYGIDLPKELPEQFAHL